MTAQTDVGLDDLGKACGVTKSACETIEMGLAALAVECSATISKVSVQVEALLGSLPGHLDDEHLSANAYLAAGLDGAYACDEHLSATVVDDLSRHARIFAQFRAAVSEWQKASTYTQACAPQGTITVKDKSQ